MTAMVLVPLALVAIATALAIRAATMRRAQVIESVERLAAYGYAAEQQPKRRSRRRSLLAAVEPVGAAAARRLGRRLSGGGEEEIRALLRGAGLYGVTPAGYAAARVLGLALAVGCSGWLFAAGFPVLTAFLLAALLVGGAWFLPPVELRRRRTARLRRIDRQLSDLVDFLVATVEAGVGFTSALHSAARRFEAPLGEELRLTVQEEMMGLGPEEALRNFLARCNTPMTRSFVRSILQAETLGVPIGQILRSLATELRKRRRQAAEEQAHKAPVKIVFPLAFLILPALFLVVLGPAAYDLVHSFGGS